MAPPAHRPVLPDRPSVDDLPDTVPLQTGFFRRPVVEVAREVLGGCIVSLVGGARVAGVIVETEAYGGPADPASHAATRSGVTRRNRAMFGPPGRAYVYRSYGIHWCMNVVTGEPGEGGAVLLRGILPILGSEVMRRRRRHRTPLGAGPGRLTEALGIDGELYGHDLREPPLQILPGWSVPEERVAASGRIGIREAADWPHRFYVRGSAGVTPG